MDNSIKKTTTKSSVNTYATANRPEIQDSLKKGNKSIQVKQELTTISEYQTKIMNNNFTNISFGQQVDAVNEYSNTEVRVAWIEVSLDAWKNSGLSGKELDDKIAADFKEYLKAKPESCIYKILSTEPILTDGQKNAIKNNIGNVSIESIGEKQLVKYGKGNPNEGEPVLWNGKKQYKALFFSETAKSDVDLRTVSEDKVDTLPERMSKVIEDITIEEPELEVVA